MSNFSRHFKEEAIWGEREVVKFRWVLIAAIFLLIGNIYLSGYPEKALISVYLATPYLIFNAFLDLIIKKYGETVWLRYICSLVDVTTLSAHIFTYAYFFEASAVITAASVHLYAVLILLTLLRYDGYLVVFTTAYTILAYNFIYFLLRPHIDPNLLSQVDLFGWPSMVYRSVYFGLMAFYLFSIPKLLDLLLKKQVRVLEEGKRTEIKLALEQQDKAMALKHLEAERKLSELLNAQKQMIEQQNIQLQELVATKDKLFSIIGHDLRTPLSIQNSIGNLLLSDFDDLPKDYLKECVTTMRDASLNGIMLLSNLLDWAKAQNNYAIFHPVKFNVNELLTDVMDLMSNNFKFKNIDIHKNFGDKLEGYGDVQMTKTIYRNILSNAIKFTPFGGRIDVYAELEGHNLIVSFKDSGIGIRGDRLMNLFQLDSTASTVGTNLETGSGLGLVLCKDLVEKHKGRIWAESNGKTGSEFFVELPLQHESVENIAMR